MNYQPHLINEATFPSFVQLFATNECLVGLGRSQQDAVMERNGQLYVKSVLNTELKSWSSCRSTFFDTPGSALWVILDEHQTSKIVIGAVGVKMSSDGKSAELARMYVDASCRGRGLGRILVEHLVSHVRAHVKSTHASARQVHLTTPSVNIPAIQFYQRMSFVENKKFFVKGPDEALLELSELRLDLEKEEEKEGEEKEEEVVVSDTSQYHGDVAARTLHWFHPEHQAWLTRKEETNTWHGWTTVVASSVKWNEEPRLPCLPRFVTIDVKPSHRPWTKDLDATDAPFYRWFVGGLTNAAFNEVDRHVLAGRGSSIALITDPPTANIQSNDIGGDGSGGGSGGGSDEGRGESDQGGGERCTYFNLLLESCLASSIIQRLGIKSGDR